jgi:hypothetical protein
LKHGDLRGGTGRGPNHSLRTTTDCRRVAPNFRPIWLLTVDQVILSLDRFDVRRSIVPDRRVTYPALLMKTPRRISILSSEQLAQLPEAKLLAYQKKVLSVDESPDESDYSPSEALLLDNAYIWFKTDPRWRQVYDRLSNALARVQMSNA